MAVKITKRFYDELKKSQVEQNGFIFSKYLDTEVGVLEDFKELTFKLPHYEDNKDSFYVEAKIGDYILIYNNKVVDVCSKARKNYLNT